MIIGFLISVLYLFSDFFYWAKWAASVIALRLWKRIHGKRFDLYDSDAENQPEKLGILVPKEERIIETPSPEEHLQNGADEILMYGINSKSESLVVRVARAPNDESEAWIYLKLKDGGCYELQKRAGYQRNYGGKCTSFTCGGLQMHYLLPMRRWRVVYCGMLKEGIKKGENTERKEVFVKFTFLWTASSDVYDPSNDLDIRATADAMANSKWASFVPPVNEIAEVLNCYCQSGVISGTISIEDEPEVEMYLFGERIRNLGKSPFTVGCKFKHVLGVSPASGLTVHVGRTSIPNALHNLHFGFIVHPDSYIRVIEEGFIISRMSGNAESKEDLTVMFKAERQYELRGNFVGDGVRFTSEQGGNERFELIEIEFETDGIKGSGFMISGEILKLPERKSERIPPSLPAVRPLTVYFTDGASHFTDLTGGKGSSLGLLTTLSSEMKSVFTVPKGIVVTTAAYNEFLTPDIIDKVDKLKDIAYGNTEGNIQEACKIVTSAVERAFLPDKIKKEIEEKLRKIFDGNINQHKVAVRSSATGEDTDQMSAAGQMDTFLGVQGLKEIFNAVKKCWASQFAYIATQYKRQNGQILNSPMAVVIQEMVECEAAGVLFTCDPVTNNPTVTVITGNYGLGESVVSGSEEPDTVVLKKLPTNEVEIQSVTVGLKQHRIVMTDAKPADDEDTVVTEDVPEDKRNECCISQEMAVRLGKLSLKIENYFKSPRDIEWGIKDNAIYILQSRPITTGAAATDYEIKHEFDGPLRCEGEFFTVCNTGEAMPGAASPLGLDVLHRYFGLLFQQKVMKEGKKDSFLQHKYFVSGMPTFYNHMTLTVLDIIARGDDGDSISAQSMMVAIFGRILDEPELKVLAQYRELVKTKPSLKTLLGLLQNLFFFGHGMKELKEEMFAYKVPAERGRTSTEIYDLLMHSCSDFIKPCMNHIICSGMSSTWNMYMLATLASAKGGLDTEVYSDFSKLLSTSTNVESADIPSAIQDLAQGIAKDMKSEDFKSMTVEEAQKWLETSTGMAGFKFRKFIKRHGHRCLKESDMYSSPWYIDPKPLICLLQNMAGTCEDVKEKKEEDLSTILPQLSVPMSLKTKLLLRFLLHFCRKGVRGREAGKSILIKFMDSMRRGFRHLSKMMVSEGYLPETELLYFLSLDEIQYLLETRNPRLIARANQRRKMFPTLNSLVLPEMWKGLAVPINEKQDEEIEYVADLTMKGVPVSQGTTKGYARVALNLVEASHLKRGEILITLGTDIGWSPYFPILAGVVTELGGLISHGAVVSREYGLPCVVGLHGATKKFVTGDYVLLDGNKGILKRLTPPEQ